MAISRGFDSIEEHDEYIINKWNNKVNKKDSVWILGDLTMEKRNCECLNKIKVVKFIVGAHTERKIIYTHIPVHPQELECRYRYNIHAHTHENTIPDERYICVSCEQVNYEPRSLEELMKK